MIYLSRKMFLPIFILLTLVFALPLGCAVAAIIIEFDATTMVAFSLVLSAYVFFSVLAKICTVLSKTHLIFEKNKLEIHMSRKGKEEVFHISDSEILRLEYCKLSSWKAWLTLLVGNVLPRSVYVVYRENGMEVSTHIGYMDYIQVTQLAEQKRVDLIFH